MKRFLVLLASLNFVQTAPVVLWLNGYNQEQGPSIIQTVEPGAHLYLATNDANKYLEKIQITSGAVTFTLDQLLNGQQFTVVDKLTIKSDIPAETAKYLTGYLYVTSAAQVKDSTFSVKVVNGPSPLVVNNFKSTTVILNTATVAAFPPFDMPAKTTYVTEMKHASNVHVNFHYGFPGSDYTTLTENQFFENPKMVPQFNENGDPPVDKEVFFENVEPLQIRVPYWYITADGPFQMMVDSKYVDTQVQDVQTVKSTGLIVISDVLMEQKVNFPVDPTVKGVTGILLTTFLDYPIEIYYANPTSTNTQGYTGIKKHLESSTNFATTQITINATSLAPGTFYCQYFVIGQAPVSTTTPMSIISSTFSSTIAYIISTTTHGSANSLDLFQLAFTFLMYNLWRGF